ARKQGKGSELQQKIWTAAWTLDPAGGPRVDFEKLKQPTLEALAQEVALDIARFRADLESADCKQSLERDQREMAAIGVSGTPAFFINGRRYMGARTADGFDAFVQEEIRKVDAALTGGAAVASYYDSLMKSAKRAP